MVDRLGMFGNIAHNRYARASERLNVKLDGQLRREGSSACRAIIYELSADGFLLHLQGIPQLHERVQLGLAGVGLIPARVVRATPSGCACTFDTSLRPDQLSAALARDNVIAVDFRGSRESAIVILNETNFVDRSDRYPGWVRGLIWALALGMSWEISTTLARAIWRLL
jgi:hypothetical protein